MILPRETSIADAHDIGLQLQHKIEDMDNVERCFVHIDYTARSYNEHDETSWPDSFYTELHGAPRQRVADRPSDAVV
jgi:hypothetical protein